MKKAQQIIINRTKYWVEAVVVGLNLCPFAKRELARKSLCYSVSEAKTEEQLLSDLQIALTTIVHSEEIETTLLIHPHVLQDFDAYNQFLDYADALLVQMDLEGIYQIASFHPHYQFANTESEDVRNYSNKSPYPMLHIISEESIERAVKSYPDSTLIPLRNQELLSSLGKDKLKAIAALKLTD